MACAGRFALLLLTVVAGSSCKSESDLLVPRDGGGGAGGGASGASGGGGSGGAGGGGGSGGFSGAGGGGGGSGTGGSGGFSGTVGGGGFSGTGGSGGGASGSGGSAGGPALPTLDAPCDWRGAGHASDLAFTPDGALLLAAGGAYVRAFEAATGQKVHHPLAPDRPAVRCGPLAGRPLVCDVRDLRPRCTNLQWRGRGLADRRSQPGTDFAGWHLRRYRRLLVGRHDAGVSTPPGALRPPAGRIMIFDLTHSPWLPR